MSEDIEGLLRQVAQEARSADQAGSAGDSAAVAARQERLLAALPRIVVELRGRGIAEDELFAAVLAALRELPDEG